MTTNQTTPDERENVTDASRTNYSGTCGEQVEPVTFFQYRRSLGDSTTVFGEGVESSVVVEDGQLTLTVTVDELDRAEDLLGRDILGVELTAKDVPQENDSA